MVRWLLALVLFAAVVGCGGEVTEVVVRVEADPGVEAIVDHLELRASNPGGEPRTATSNVGPGDYPRTIGLQEKLGANGPITVVVVGREAGVPRVEAKGRFTFTEGESRQVVLRLHDACLDQFDCTGESRCGPTGSCIPIDVRTEPR